MRRSILALLAIAAAIGAGLILRSRDPRPIALWNLAPGQRALYRFRHTLEGRVPLPLGEQAQAVETTIDLDAQIAFIGLARDPEGVRLGFSFPSFERHRFTVAGAELVKDPRPLEAARAEVRFDRRGRVVELRFGNGAPEVFESLTQLVLSELALPLPEAPADRWSAEEQTQSGEVESRFVRAGEAVLRTRASYRSLQAFLARRGAPVESRARFELGVVGLERVDASERIAVEGMSRVSVTTLRLEAIDRAPIARLERSHPRVPGEPATSPRARVRRLERRAEGLPRERMLEDLRLIAPFGRLPDHAAWFSRALARLELEPELRGELAFLYHGRNTFQGRELILDLLVWEGSAASQETLVELIDSETTRMSRDPTGLFQRIALVEHPTPATLAYLERQAFEGSGDLRFAAIYAAGAAGKKAGPRGEALLDRLVAALGASDDPEEQAHLLSGVGNAARARDSPLIAGLAASRNTRVRVHVAGALRNFDAARARELLVDLALDPSGRVQRRSLRALATRGELADDQLARLAEGVSDGRIDERSLPLLVNLVAPATRKTAAVAAVLRAVTEREFAGDPHVRGRAQLLLDHPLTLR